MKLHFSVQNSVFETAEQRISYRLYRNRYSEKGRRLLLLHGAGVTGEDTWDYIVSNLKGWHEVLVPDMRGMGQTWDLDRRERRYQLEEVVGDQINLLDHLGWWAFDLGGYSFGGLVSMILKQLYPHRVHKQFLIESAMIDQSDSKLATANQLHYSTIARQVRYNNSPEQDLLEFLNRVSPNRIASPENDALSINKLNSRPRGFANALDAVVDTCQRIDRSNLLSEQGDISSFVGSLSVDTMHQFNRQLRDQLDSWHYHSISDCDHTLPFQKPKEIARLMDLDLEHYLRR